MSLARLLIIVALIGGGVHLWRKHQEAQAFAAVTSPNGFLPVLMPDGAVPNKVLVFAPLNCPREGAQRARALSQDLTNRGISNALTDRYSLAAVSPGPDTAAAVKRTSAVMSGELPIVLVNGMGKANPSTAEVVAELAQTQERFLNHE